MLSVYLTLAAYAAGYDIFVHLCDNAPESIEDEVPLEPSELKDVA